jgi:hypothetical protein
VTDIVAGVVTLKSCAVPVIAMVWGLAAALSVSVMAPVRGLFAVEDGLKVTLTAQVASGATV